MTKFTSTSLLIAALGLCGCPHYEQRPKNDVAVARGENVRMEKIEEELLAEGVDLNNLSASEKTVAGLNATDLKALREKLESFMNLGNDVVRVSNLQGSHEFDRDKISEQLSVVDNLIKEIDSETAATTAPPPQAAATAG